MNILLASPGTGIDRLLQDIAEQQGYHIQLWSDEQQAPPTDGINLVITNLDHDYAAGLKLFFKIRSTPQFRLCYQLALIDEHNPSISSQLYELGFDNLLEWPSQDEQTMSCQLRFIERQIQLRERLQEAEKAVVAASAELSSQRNEMHNTLNHLRIGSCMINERGNLTFLSDMAQKIFGVSDINYLARPWQEVLSFKPSDITILNESISANRDQSFSHSFHLRTPRGRYYWIDVEVIATPSSPARKTLLFYDMSEMHDLRRMLDNKAQFHDLVGKSKSMLEIYRLIQDIANVNMTTLIEGETGTGKELVARAIHSSGARKDKPFIAVNCAGLTDSLLTSQLFGHRRGAFTGAIEDHKGVFEAADGGTLFLDEIGEIPMNVQTTLLRVLQEREVTRVGDNKPRKVDVHLIAATNRNLVEEVDKGSFRSDLLYRIRVARLNTPPLRERNEDIPLLVSALLTKKRAATGKPVQGISNPALRILLDYSWPGNVRELENVVEYAVLRCHNDMINLQDLPPELTGATGNDGINSHGQLRPNNPRQQILDALEQSQGSRIKAAKLLGISRATFYRRLEKLGINPTDYCQ